MSQRGSLRKRGNTWTAYWWLIDADGKRRQRSKGGFRTKAEANAYLTDQLARLADGSYAEPSKSTLADFVRDEWLPSRKNQVRTSTWASYQDVLEGRVLPRLGGYRLPAITPKMLDELYRELLTSGGRDARKGPGLSARSVRYTAMVVRRVLADAMRRGHITRNPADLVDPPTPGRTEMKVWTAEQARAFLTAVSGDRLEALWVLALTTGLRRGELLGLRWSNVDLDAGRLSITRTLVAVGYRMEWSEPKTAKSRRSVAIDTGTITALRSHRKAQLEERIAMGADYIDESLVFARENGEPIHPQSLSDRFERLAAAANLPAIRLHDLRHTSATLALAAGIHPKIVSERLGHSSINITIDTYSHVVEGMQEDAAEQLGGMLLGERTVDQADRHG